MDSAKAYEENAREFLRNRDRSKVGFKVVQEWARRLPKGTDVLELACGGGYPITTELKEAGLNIWAIDSSKTMLATFRSRFPEAQTQCERIQDSSFFNRKFDAVVSIGILFLLPENEQIEFIERVSKVLRPNGRFLFTAPIETGKWNDLNTGIECHSLGLAAYTKIIEDSGLKVLSRIVDKGGNNHYDTEKQA